MYNNEQFIEQLKTDLEKEGIKYINNEINPKFLSQLGMNSFIHHNSASRNQMYFSHLSQALQILGAEVKVIQTGSETEFGKYTFKVEMPVDGYILDIIPKYNRINFQHDMENPETYVIYEDIITREIGVLVLPVYFSQHQYLGFRYAKTPSINLLKKNTTIQKGTIFLDSPSITHDGDYMFGINANVAFMSHPAVSDDGMVVSKQFLNKLGFKKYHKRVIEYGANSFPLNVYGDLNTYKPFPEIGDYVRSDGLLCALRKTDIPELFPVEKCVDDVNKIDMIFDDTTYVEYGRVIDITIHHDIKNTNYLENGPDSFANKYDKFNREFYERIYDIYTRLYKERGNQLQVTHELHKLVLDSLILNHERPFKGGSGRNNTEKLYKQTPMDTYRIEFVIECDSIPYIGDKVSDLNGGKGVICKVMDEADMPMDANGNRADVIVDSNSLINRMNLGRLYEVYITASARDVQLRICRNLDIPTYYKGKDLMNRLLSISDDKIDNEYNYLLKFIALVSPIMRSYYENITDSKRDVLADVICKGVYLYIPNQNPVYLPSLVTKLESMPEYRPIHTPVTYRGNSGNIVTTKDNVRISRLYLILLEKIADVWSAVSSGKIQHFGVLGKLTNTDKYSKPIRLQPVRHYGEAEVRTLAAHLNPYVLAEIMDRNNNPPIHKVICKEVLTHSTPTNISKIVNRNKHKYGGNKINKIARHLATCAGTDFVYNKYNSGE